METQEMENSGAGNGFVTTSASAKTIQAGLKPEGWNITTENKFGLLTLAELVEEFGESTITDMVKSRIVVSHQAQVRALAQQGLADEVIKERMASWKPGQRQAPVASPETILKNFGNMSAEQQKALIAKLSAMTA